MAKGCFPPSLACVERIRRHQAPTLCEGAVEHPGRGDGLGTGVDGVFRLRRVLGPVRHEAPLQQIEVALTGLGMTADDHRGLRRADVPGRCNVRQRIHRLEEPSNELGRL